MMVVGGKKFRVPQTRLKRVLTRPGFVSLTCNAQQGLNIWRWCYKSFHRCLDQVETDAGAESATALSLQSLPRCLRVGAQPSCSENSETGRLLIQSGHG